MGRVWSFENLKSGRRPRYLRGKATHTPTVARAGGWSRVVVDPRHAEKLHAREPGDLFGVPRWDRSGKAESRTPDVYAGEESDRAVIPMKPPNKEAQASAEVVEGRARTKENTSQSHTSPAQDGRGVSQGLAGVRHVSY